METMIISALAEALRMKAMEPRGNGPGVLRGAVLHFVVLHFVDLHYKMTSSNGNIFRVTGHSCGEFTGDRWPVTAQKPLTRSFDIFFDPRMNKRLSKQTWSW